MRASRRERAESQSAVAHHGVVEVVLYAPAGSDTQLVIGRDLDGAATSQQVLPPTNGRHFNTTLVDFNEVVREDRIAPAESVEFVDGLPQLFVDRVAEYASTT